MNISHVKMFLKMTKWRKISEDDGICKRKAETEEEDENEEVGFLPHCFGIRRTFNDNLTSYNA